MSASNASAAATASDSSSPTGPNADGGYCWGCRLCRKCLDPGPPSTIDLSPSARSSDCSDGDITHSDGPSDSDVSRQACRLCRQARQAGSSDARSQVSDFQTILLSASNAFAAAANDSSSPTGPNADGGYCWGCRLCQKCLDPGPPSTIDLSPSTRSSDCSDITHTWTYGPSDEDESRQAESGADDVNRQTPNLGSDNQPRPALLSATAPSASATQTLGRPTGLSASLPSSGERWGQASASASFPDEAENAEGVMPCKRPRLESHSV